MTGGKTVIAKFIKDEDGATLIEYGLMAAMIAVGAIAAFGVFGGGLSGIFDSTANAANNSLTSAGGTLG